jgi:DNA-binding transcriptional ArsR family regulator
MITAERQFAALADPSRRAIFEKLARQPLPVGELAALFPISRPAVSQHLRVLSDAQLVLHQRDGTQNIYRVNHQGIARLRDYLDTMWTQALGDFKTVAEASYRDRKSRKEKP